MEKQYEFRGKEWRANVNVPRGGLARTSIL
jgi:hypothetical protein